MGRAGTVLTAQGFSNLASDESVSRIELVPERYREEKRPRFGAVQVS